MDRNRLFTRAYVLFAAFAIGAICIAGKILHIQFIDGAKWQTKVAHLTTELREIPATRGNIYADSGDLLATSVPIYEIRMDLKAEGLDAADFNANIDSLCIELSGLFGDRTAAQYRDRLVTARKAGNRYYLVKNNVDFDQARQTEKFHLFRRGRFKSGVIYEKQNKRIQPLGDIASRTIGYSRPGIQPVGLEGSYDDLLGGRPGQRYEKRLAGGVWMPINNSNEVDPEDGCDIYSTIDVNIQDVANSALRKQLKKHNARHGCAILMEVKTGYIKAIANLSLSGDSTYTESYNYAVGEATEPGSTFKLASMMAAFEDGKLTIHDSVDTKNGTHRFYDRIMRDSNHEGYGKVDVLTAFQKSSNVGISRLINDQYAADPEQFISRLRKMGLGQPLGIELPGEGKPQLKSPTDPSWSGVTLPWMSIGYELLMTPLQILTFYNAVANNGVMMRPLFVSEVRKNGKLIEKIDPQVINPSIASRSTIEQARQMLESVVSEGGTASNLRFGAYSIAGKTGTAQIANAQYGYKYDQAVSYQASFVGYFPSEAPEYACIVVVNGPSNNVYYGNQVAGPVFKEIADKVYAQRFDLIKSQELPHTHTALHVPISKAGNAEDLRAIFKTLRVPYEEVGQQLDWVSTTSQVDSVVISPRSIKEGLVPNVLGMSLRDGLYVLEQMGLEVRISGKGMIARQSILPGSTVRKGQIIMIELT